MNPKWKVKQLYTGAGIYQFTCNITGMKYIGSSKNCYKRVQQHINETLNGVNGCMSNFIIIEDDYSIDILERLPNYTKKQLVVSEQKNMNLIDTNLLINKCMAFSGLTEKEYMVKYWIDNKEILSEKIKTQRNLNLKKFRDREALYREKNRDIIRVKSCIKHTCELCGGSYTNSHKAEHLKSKKHIDFTS